MKRIIYCSIDPLQYVDIHTTGTSDNDEFLSEKGREYKLTHKNRKGGIVYMSPNEYFRTCAHDLFHVPVSKLIGGRRGDEDSLQWQKQQIQNGNKLPLPYINYSNGEQEGLHRMMALGDVFGWDEEFPVLVIEVADEHKEDVEYVYRYLSKAVSEAKTYQYPEDKLVEYFRDQVQYELYDWQDEDEHYDVVVTDSAELLSVSLEGYESDIKINVYKDDLRISEATSSDDIDIDDYMDELSADEFAELFGL